MNEKRYTVKNYLRKKDEKNKYLAAPSFLSETKNKLKEMYKVELLNIYWAERELIDTISEIINSKTLLSINGFIQSDLIETPSNSSKLENYFGKLFFNSDMFICSAMERLVNNLKPEKYHFLFSGKLSEEFLRRFDKMIKYKIATYDIIHSFAISLGDIDVSDLMYKIISCEKEKEIKIKKYISLNFSQYLN